MSQTVRPILIDPIDWQLEAALDSRYKALALDCLIDNVYWPLQSAGES